MAFKERFQTKTIIQTVTHLGPGGVQSLVIPLSIELLKKGYNIILLSYCPALNKYQQDIYELLIKNGVKIIIPKRELKNPIQRFIYTFDLIKNNKYSIIHIHTPIPNLYISIPSVFFGIKQVMTFHSIKLWTNSREHFCGNIKLQLIKPFISRYVAISQTVKHSIIKNYSINSNKTKIIYNGIEIEKYKINKVNDNFKKEIVRDSNSFVITHIGTIDFKIKNQDKVVELYDDIIESIPTAFILFVGEGNDFDKLKRLIKNKTRIKAIGNRGDIKEILSITDLAILPSSKEGLPLVLLETMAAGIPMLAANVGSIPEIIKCGCNGETFDYPNFNEFFEKILELYNNPCKRNELSLNAQKDIEKYSMSNFVLGHDNLYKTLYLNIQK